MSLDCKPYHQEGNRHKKLTAGFFLVGMASVIWFVLRTGRKPSRIVYPCQQIALSNSIALFAAIAAFICISWRKSQSKLRFAKIPMAFLLLGILLSSDVRFFIGGSNPLKIAYQPVVAHAASPLMGKVVRIFDEQVTYWNGSGWYGNYVDQEIVNQMFDRGLMELTGTATIQEAWSQIIPSYQPGQKIAIKANMVNANDNGETGNRVDALPQIVNAIARGLRTIGAKETDITVYEATDSRRIPDRFVEKLLPGINVVDRVRGNATFNSTDPSAMIGFSRPGMSHKVVDLLVETDYLIDMPILKGHQYAGVTLSFKNHIGSLSGFYEDIHSYIIFEEPSYTPDYNALVDIYLNKNISAKTVLIVGDGLFGAESYNAIPLIDGCKSLFLATDPVAIDSVMIDWLATQWTLPPNSDDYLYLAAQAGLGTYERSSDFRYSLIDYSELTLDAELKGDLNLDNQIDHADIRLCIDVMLDREDDTEIIRRANLNRDNEVNVLDLQELIKLVGER